MSTVMKQISNANQKFKDLGKTKPKMQLDMSTVIKQIANVASKIKALANIQPTIKVKFTGSGTLKATGSACKTSTKSPETGGSLITIIGHYALFKIGKEIEDNSELVYHWQLVLKHNGHTAKMWKQRVWPKYKPMLWYFKRSGNGNMQGPTMYSDIEDLIESQPVDKTMHDWEQSTIEAEHIIRPLTVEGQIVLDPFMGYGTNGIAALKLNRKFIGIEIDREHYSRAACRLSKSSHFPF